MVDDPATAETVDLAIDNSDGDMRRLIDLAQQMAAATAPTEQISIIVHSHRLEAAAAAAARSAGLVCKISVFPISREGEPTPTIGVRCSDIILERGAEKRAGMLILFGPRVPL